MELSDKVAFFSAKSINDSVDLLPSIKRVIDSHWYILGEEVKSFEREFAKYVGVGNCIGVGNGTDAIEIALRGLEVGVGDLVVTTANSGFYSSSAIRAIGAIPLYVDVDPDTLTISSKALAEVIDKKPKAVIATHLYGQLCNIPELLTITQNTGIPLIEDCAQAHGAKFSDRVAGSFGDIGCFSFYPTKNLGAIGDGGALTINEPNLADKVRLLRQYGWAQKYQVNISGGSNSRLDELQAAVLREKLPYLDLWNEARRSIAKKYSTAFSSLPILCPQRFDEGYVAHLYVIRVDQRDEFRAYLHEHGITTDVHYPIPDHMQRAYSDFVAGDLAVTEAVAKMVVSLPCYPGLSEEQVDRVIRTVLNFFEK